MILFRTLLTMALFSWLFSGCSKKSVSHQELPAGQAASPSPKTMPSDTRAFTTGLEQIVMEQPGIAFIPPEGWSPFTAVKKEQKPTDVRIANPSLLGKAGMITCLLYPEDGLSVTQRVDQFVERMTGRVVERAEKVSASGIPVTYLHIAAPVPGKTIEGHSIHCCFANRSGQVVDLYCVGSTEADARTTADAFLATLRFEP